MKTHLKGLAGCLLAILALPAVAASEELTLRDVVVQSAPDALASLGRVLNARLKDFGPVEKVALEYSFQVFEGGEWLTLNGQEVDRREFRLGDLFRLVVTPYSDCYVYVINQGPLGKVSCVYPRDGRAVKLTQAAERHVIPDPDPVEQQERSFEFNAPAGNEKLYVVATLRPVEGEKNIDRLAREVCQPPPDRLPAGQPAGQPAEPAPKVAAEPAPVAPPFQGVVLSDEYNESLAKDEKQGVLRGVLTRSRLGDFFDKLSQQGGQGPKALLFRDAAFGGGAFVVAIWKRNFADNAHYAGRITLTTKPN